MLKMIHHSAVGPDNTTVIRDYDFDIMEPYAQYDKALCVKYVEPKKRRWKCFTITPGNLSYVLIEDDHLTLFDSRDIIECDMVKFNETQARFSEVRKANQWLSNR
jgi:hypothetical protein